jgi:hypothetical protein
MGHVPGHGAAAQAPSSRQPITGARLGLLAGGLGLGLGLGRLGRLGLGRLGLGLG